MINSVTKSANKSSSVRGLGKNVSWSLIGNIVYASSQFGILIAINKFGTVQMVGQYGLGLAITAPLFKFLNMQLSTVQASDSKNDYSFNDYFNTRLLSSIVGIVLLCLIFFIKGFNFETKLIVFLIGVSKFIETISDIIYGGMQKVERMDIISISKVLRGVISLILFFITMYLTNNIILAVITIILSWTLVLLFFDYRKSKQINSQNKGISQLIKEGNKGLNTLKRIIVLSLPLGLAGTIDLINVNLPRYVIQFYYSEEILGYFVSIAYLMVAGGTLIDSVAASAIPRLSRLFQSNLEGYKKMLNKLILFAIGIGFLGIVISFCFGGIILTILYSSSYAKYDDLLTIIMFGSALWYLAGFLSSGLSSAQIYRPQLPIFIITAIVILISSVVLVPQFGLNGAGFSLCMGMLTRTIISVAVLKSYIRKSPVSIPYSK